MLILPLSFFFLSFLITIITTLIYGQGRGSRRHKEIQENKNNNNAVGGGYMVLNQPKKKKKKKKNSCFFI